MRLESKKAYQKAREAHWEIVQQSELLRLALSSSGNISELADALYALKQIAELCDDARKEANRLIELFEKLTCRLWVLQDNGDLIRTEYCTASPDIKQTVKTPKEGTPEYAEFASSFGVPPDVPFRPHWPSIIKRVSEDMAAGKPLPPGCDPREIINICKVGIRKKRAILDEGELPPVQTTEKLRKLTEVLKALVVLDSPDAEISRIQETILCILEDKESVEESNPF